jgi:hypothetical protein
MNQPDTSHLIQPAASPKKPYEKPQVTSHQVFEVSLACIKIPGSTMCNFNLARARS